MTVTFIPSKATGTVTLPPSKSISHRAVICAALAEGISTIRNVSYGEDLNATEQCLSALSVSTERHGGDWRVRGADFHAVRTNNILNCAESGSTMRFLIPLLLLSGEKFCLTGSPRLLDRPMDVYSNLFKKSGVRFMKCPNRYEVCGKLSAGVYEIPGNISSQFASGLLLALPLLDGDSELRLVAPVESRPYIDLTIGVMKDFGIHILQTDDLTWQIPGRQSYQPRSYPVESDQSAAVFFGALNQLGGTVTFPDLPKNNRQGDSVWQDLVHRLSGGFCEISLRDCPDLAPMLFALAGALHGAKFTDIHRLRWKESDRVFSMKEELTPFGIILEETEDTVTVRAATFHKPDRPLSSHNDHRVAMALSVLLSVTGGTLTEAEAVEKSDPVYFNRLRSLGVSFTVQ